ncbi:Periplasmic protein TonB [Sulfurovum sp. enrichment culture clone C5]|uniref:Periplasmic protein TonB n=1 Tax=Sulfurovum sp. enrichment culture clone C5 TaxID=497650 RepID=A0A0S4XLA4_9BACT|nr:Periplasmic protein TonB [Sulfurovum sp. enrichment culture clone C5]
MNRYAHSFLISFLIYTVFIFSALFMLRDIQKHKINSETIVKMAIINPQEESVQKQVAKAEPKEEKVQEKPKDEPIQKIETTKPSVVSKTVPIKQAEVAKKEKEKSDSKQLISQKSYVSTQAEKDQFISDLKNKIKQNKYYPEVARNRGQEGVVKVSFCVNSDGSVSDIVCSGEYSVLNSAAKNAVAKTFPVKVPANVIATRLQLSVVLNYNLD